MRNVAALLGLDANDLVIEVIDTQLIDTVPAQKRPEFPGVQMVGVIRQAREFGCGNQLGCQAMTAEACLKAHAVRESLVPRIFQPIRSEVAFFVAYRQRKWMVVGVRIASVHPSHELRALLE